MRSVFIVATARAEQSLRRWPLGELVHTVLEQYGAVMVITETGHVGNMRPIRLRELGLEAENVIRDGLPLNGVCLYPVLGMPEWHQPEEWTQMGFETQRTEVEARTL